MTSGRSSKSASSRRPAQPRAPSVSLEPTPGFVAVGRVTGARGLRGELLVTPLTDFPERFAAGSRLWLAGEPREVAASAGRGDRVGVRLRGVGSREQAQALRGRLLEVPEPELRELAPGTYYRHQLLGMAVSDREGRLLGTLEDIISTGANDVYVVHGGGGEVLLPALDDVILEVDVAGRRMVVDPPDEPEPV